MAWQPPYIISTVSTVATMLTGWNSWQLNPSYSPTTFNYYVVARTAAIGYSEARGAHPQLSVMYGFDGQNWTQADGPLEPDTNGNMIDYDHYTVSGYRVGSTLFISRLKLDDTMFPGDAPNAYVRLHTFDLDTQTWADLGGDSPEKITHTYSFYGTSHFPVVRESGEIVLFYSRGASGVNSDAKFVRATSAGVWGTPTTIKAGVTDTVYDVPVGAMIDGDGVIHVILLERDENTNSFRLLHYRVETDNSVTGGETISERSGSNYIDMGNIITWDGGTKLAVVYSNQDSKSWLVTSDSLAAGATWTDFTYNDGTWGGSVMYEGPLTFAAEVTGGIELFYYDANKDPSQTPLGLSTLISRRIWKPADGGTLSCKFIEAAPFYVYGGGFIPLRATTFDYGDAYVVVWYDENQLRFDIWSVCEDSGGGGGGGSSSGNHAF